MLLIYKNKIANSIENAMKIWNSALSPISHFVWESRLTHTVWAWSCFKWRSFGKISKLCQPETSSFSTIILLFLLWSHVARRLCMYLISFQAHRKMKFQFHSVRLFFVITFPERRDWGHKNCRNIFQSFQLFIERGESFSSTFFHLVWVCYFSVFASDVPEWGIFLSISCFRGRNCSIGRRFHQLSHMLKQLQTFKGFCQWNPSDGLIDNIHSNLST